MGRRWIAERGLEVELIQLDDGPCLRARRYRCLVGAGYFRTVDGLEAALAPSGQGLLDLVEVLPLRRPA